MLVTLVAALVALLVLGRDSEERPASFGVRRLAALPAADRADVLTSTWFCAAGVAQPGGANLSVSIANPTATARRGTLSWLPTGAGAAVDVPFRVGARDVVTLQAIEFLRAPTVSAVVETIGGGVVVEHVLNGRRGSAVAPCSPRASDQWFLANGITERDATEVLALFNPFPSYAVVDIDFDTNLGREAPAALQGLPIAPRSTLFVDVGRSVRRRAVAAAAVRARVGSLVVDRVQAFDGSAGRSGMSLALAAAAPAEEWFFAEGLWSDVVIERWHLFNPGDREAEVTLQLVPDAGDVPQPVELTVAAGGQLTVDAKDVGGVPAGVAHSSTVTSDNGVRILAERETDVRAPARRGWSSSFGATRTATRWALAVGETSGATDEWIVVHNPGTAERRFSIVALAGGQLLPIEGLQDLRVPAAGRVAARLGDHVQRGPLPIVVAADGGVVVERDLYGVGRTLVAATVGLPLEAATGEDR